MKISQRQIAGSSGRPPAVDHTVGAAISGTQTVEVSGSEQVDSADLHGIRALVSEVLSADQASRSERIQQLTMLVDTGAYKVDAAGLSRAIVTALLKE
jgi:anti-sigma28 factor (negative regulator of flagellin synthesis)